MKERLCLVVHRFGDKVVGGAEMECKLFAEKLSKIYDIDIVTTCAIDDSTWENYYTPGVEYINNIKIYRFMTVYNRSWNLWNNMNHILYECHSYEEEIQLLQEIGPYSKDMLEYIVLNSSKYSAVLFFTYMYYQTSICMLGVQNAIMVPTVHDEPLLSLRHFKKVFTHPKAFIFQTIEEKALVEKKFGSISKPWAICGVGVDDLSIGDETLNFDTFFLPKEYCVYAGRISPAKGCDHMIYNFIEYKKKYNSNLKLILIGKTYMDIPKHQDIITLGFVDDNKKNFIIKNSKFAIIPSAFESLSILLLESMYMGKPVLVNGESNVLSGHIYKSNAGLIYRNSKEFIDNINFIMNNNDKYEAMSKNARMYINKNYTWNIIINKIKNLIDNIKKDMNIDNINYEININKSKLYPIFKENCCTIIYASDNNYVPYLCVSLQSLIKNSNTKYNYDIIILSDGILHEKINIINTITKKYRNISIRFIEISNMLNGIKFSFTNKSLTRATFIRLLLPDILQDYEKIVYIDCDTIILDDIYNLFNIDISKNLFGAIEDQHIKVIKTYRDEVKKHLINNIHISESDKYFNAGVLLINMRLLKKLYSSSELLNIATSKNWMWEDQDVLNFISKNKIVWIEEEWNVLWVNSLPIQNLMELDIAYLNSSKKPKLLHFAGGRLPTKDIKDKNSYIFWMYARESPFYEELLLLAIKNEIIHKFNINCQRIVDEKISYMISNKINNNINNKNIILIYIKKYIYTILSKLTSGNIRKKIFNKRKKYENIINNDHIN